MTPLIPLPVVSQFEAAGMPEHMGVDQITARASASMRGVLPSSA